MQNAQPMLKYSRRANPDLVRNSKRPGPWLVDRPFPKVSDREACEMACESFMNIERAIDQLEDDLDYADKKLAGMLSFYSEEHKRMRAERSAERLLQKRVGEAREGVTALKAKMEKRQGRAVSV